MSIGFGASQLLIELGRKDKVKSPDLLHKFQIFAEFFTNDVLFIVTIIKKLLEKSPTAFNIVKNTYLFDPCVLVSEKSELLHKKIECFTNPSDEIKTFCLQHSVAKLMDNSLSFLAMS